MPTLPFERLVEACDVARDCNLRGRELRAYLRAYLSEVAPARPTVKVRPPSPGAVDRANLRKLRRSLAKLRALAVEAHPCDPPCDDPGCALARKVKALADKALAD